VRTRLARDLGLGRPIFASATAALNGWCRTCVLILRSARIRYAGATSRVSRSGRRAPPRR